MPDTTLMLGAAVIKIFLHIWFRDNAIADEASSSLTDLIAAKTADVRQQRKLKRLFENLEERVADHVVTFLSQEYRDVPENEREAAIYAATLTFNNASLSIPDLFDTDLDPLYLERIVRRSSVGVTRDLSSGATQLYDRVIALCCSYIVEVSSALPGFEVGVFSVLLSRETEILQRITELFDRVAALSGHQETDRFENAYRQVVAKKLDHLELFGVTISEAIRTYPLSAAYISLTVSSEVIAVRQPKQQALLFGGNADDTPTSEEQNLSIEDALSSTRRLFLRGEAGTGKTTLLQWVAVRAALRDFDEPLTDWNSLIPFLIRLRTHAGRELPRPEAFLNDVGRHIADEMPPGWVQQKLRDGQAIVLVDGIDELPDFERTAARSWLRDLLDAFPDSRFIVTSRPAAVTEAWLDGEGFDPAEIQPMTWSDVQALVEQWHAAFIGLTSEPEEHAAIRDSKRRLLAELKVHRPLMQLATNPLLTALLCALNLDRRTMLPRDRMEVYRIALEMLLERRDTERRISISTIQLSRRDKMLFLEDLAYWLIRNGWSDTSFDRVAERFEQRSSSMPRVEMSGQEIANFLLDRSGVIRRPAVDRVDFVHRTFEEYLAAAAVIDADDIGVLIEHAHDDQWREVTIMSTGHALLRQRNELFERLLDRAAEESRFRQVIQALTIACLETAPQLDVKILRRVERMAAELLPPRTMASAEALALGGDFILDQMTGRAIRNSRQAAATIRLAGLVGGDKALDQIEMCTRRLTEEVSRELVRAWPRFDPHVYGIRILRDAPLGRIKVTDPILLPALKYPRFSGLSLEFKRGHGDIRDLAGLSGVERVSIIDPWLTDVSPLSTMPDLVHADLLDTEMITLRDLPHDRLRTLHFNFNAVTDPLSLSGFTALKELDITELPDDRTAARLISPGAELSGFALWGATEVADLSTLVKLPALRRLDYLGLISAYSLRSIAGVETWADTLTRINLKAPALENSGCLADLPNLAFANLEGTPIGDISFMARLAGLWALHLGGSGNLPDLAPLRDLDELRYLFLYGTDEVDLRPLAGKEDIEIRISRLRYRHVLGMTTLGKGSKIVAF